MDILIIEDDVSIRQELKQLLENALYDVSTLTEFTNYTECIKDVYKRQLLHHEVTI